MELLDKLLRRNKNKPAAAERPVQAELWATPRSGDFLRKLGMAPTTAEAAAPKPESIAADLEQARLSFEADHADINRDIAAKFGPGHALYPFFLVPSACWNGPHGAFLTTTLGLRPHEDWNIELCADNEATALVLDAPLLPYSEVEAYAEIIEETVAALSAGIEAKPTAAARDAATREIKAVVKGLRGHWVAHCRTLLEGKSAA